MTYTIICINFLSINFLLINESSSSTQLIRLITIAFALSLRTFFVGCAV